MNFSSFIVFLLSMTFTPGPNNIISMSSGNQYGYKKTIPFILGASSGSLIYFIIMILLSKKIMIFSSELQIMLKIIGTVFMLYLATKFILNAFSKNSDVKNSNRKIFTYKDGFLLQFLNPKFLFFSLTIVGNFILPNTNSTLNAIFIAFLVVVIIYIAISVWAFFGVVIQKLFMQNKFIFNILISFLLIYCAIVMSGLF